MTGQADDPPSEQKPAKSADRTLDLLREMVEQLPIGAVLLEGDSFYLNDRAEQITGHSRDEIQNRGQWFSRLCQIEQAEAEAHYQQCREAGFREPLIYKILRRDGASRTLKIVAYRFGDQEIWILHDITARRAAQESAEQAANRMRAVLNATIDAIITIDHAGIMVHANPATERLFGYSINELIGRNVSMLMPSPYREQHDGYLANFHETGEARIIGIGREVVAQRKDGTTFPIDLAVSEVEQLDLFVGVVRDISDRRTLEQEVLRAAEEQQLATAQELHDGLGSLLTAIKFRVEGLEKRLSTSSSQETEDAAAIVKLVLDAISQTRAISHGLHPMGSSPEDLYVSLRALVASVIGNSQMKIKFHGPKEIAIHDPSVANHLFRIAQEAVNNALRHSGGCGITVSLVEGNYSGP